MPAPANLVHETSASTGTGNFTLAAVNGKQRFSTAFGTGATPDVFDYFISNQDATEWERGTGHMSAASTLVRDTVSESTNANAAVSFSAGTKDVTNDVPAAKQVTTESVSQSSSASTIVERDANQNVFFNNYFANSTEIASAAGTTVLTAASSRAQRLTGSSNQTYQLPAATTLSRGPAFTFDNNSSGSLIVTNAGGTTQYTVPAGGYVTAIVTNIGSSNGVWDFHASIPATVTWGSGTTGLVMNTALSTTPAVAAGASSATVPAFIPQRGSATTGFGGDSTHLYGIVGGTTALTVAATAFSPGASDGSALGTTALQWSDVFFASGGIINWNNGNVTITHSADALSLNNITVAIGDANFNLDLDGGAAGSPALTFDSGDQFFYDRTGNVYAFRIGSNSQFRIGSGFIDCSTNDRTSLGQATISFSDLFLASGAVVNYANGNYTITHSSGDLAFSGTVTLTNTGLHLLDTNASHDLIIKPGSDITADRTLTVTTGDTDITLDLTDAGADKLMFWDDSAGKWTALTLGTNLTITGTTINSSSGSGNWTTVTKASDETTASDTTLSNDSALLVALSINTNYLIRGEIFYDTPTAADFKFSFNGPASPTLLNIAHDAIDPNGSANGYGGDTAYGTSTSITAGTAQFGYVRFTALVRNGANSGNFAFQWAQVTSSVSNTTVRAGSYLEYRTV